MNDITAAVLGTLQALLVGVAAVLALFVGACVLLTLPKLRPSGRGSRVVRALDEVTGERQVYLPPDAPRGRVDQLRTPELLELRARKSA
jgi:hypothetical protein